MTPSELIADLRSRINPIYQNHPGTESYERRQCVDALELQQSEIKRLRTRITELDGQLGKRPCQNDRCTNHAQLLELLALARGNLWSMTDPALIERMDAALVPRNDLDDGQPTGCASPS